MSSNKSYKLNTAIMPNNKSYKLNTRIIPNNKGYNLNATIIPNDNEKETMTSAFSFEDFPKSLKNQGSF